LEVSTGILLDVQEKLTDDVGLTGFFFLFITIDVIFHFKITGVMEHKLIHIPEVRGFGAVT
jgi:hypothetical protein